MSIKRAITHAIGYEIIHILVILGVSYAFTKSISMSVSIAVVESLIMVVIHSIIEYLE